MYAVMAMKSGTKRTYIEANEGEIKIEIVPMRRWS